MHGHYILPPVRGRAVLGMGICICLGALALSFNLVCLTEVATLMKAKEKITQK